MTTNGTSHQVYDLVVVGSGFAGFSTTLAFLEKCKELGKNGKVIVIEAGKEGERHGASRWTGALLRFKKDLSFDPSWRNLMKVLSKGLADEKYCEILEKEASTTARYLLDRGAIFYHHDETKAHISFDTDQHLVYPVGGGLAVVNVLFEQIKKYSDVTITWETTAEHLLQSEDGEINGVQVRKPDGKSGKVYGHKVMLACGGFQGSQELMTQYVGPGAEHLGVIVPGLKYNTGFGLKMGLEVGAAVAGSMNGLHCELVDTRTNQPDAVVVGHNFGILVNRQCKRFYDEGNDSTMSTFELVALEVWKEQNQECFLITDKPIMELYRPGWLFDGTDKEPEKSDSIEGLAKKLDLNAEELKRTIDEFNASVNDKPFNGLILDGKRTHGLSPDKSNWANPIKEPPFYGYPLSARVTFTYGGLKVDPESHVLSTTGKPIPGLYSTGELSGLYYNSYPTGTSVLRSLTFGRLAGYAAAEAL